MPKIPLNNDLSLNFSECAIASSCHGLRNTVSRVLKKVGGAGMVPI